MPIIPWKKIGDAVTLAEGYGKRLDKQEFLDHLGRKTDFYFIEQPSWSVVFAVTEGGKVVVVRQYKQGADIITEELPGGVADFGGQPPEEVVRRELREETGYEAKEFISLGSGWMNSRNSTTKFHCFLAKNCKKVGDPHPDDGEQIEVVEIPLNDWIERALRGDIYQWGGTYLIMFRALPYLNIELRAVHGAAKK